MHFRLLVWLCEQGVSFGFLWDLDWYARRRSRRLSSEAKRRAFYYAWRTNLWREQIVARFERNGWDILDDDDWDL
jgi:hypothetical protein